MNKLLLVFTAFLAVINMTAAADAPPTRIYYLGNSLTDELKYDPFVKLAEVGGEKVEWGRHMIPGCPIRGLWGAVGQGLMKAPYGHWDKALREYEWDVVTLQPFCPFQGEYDHSLLFAQEVIKKSPEAQICIYAQWPSKNKNPDWDTAFSGPQESQGKWLREAPTSYFQTAATVPDEFKERFKEFSFRNEYELNVLGLRQNVPTKKPPVLIPAGHAMQLLGQKMRAGLMPGYRTPWDFYTDGVHVNNDGSYLVACAFYATIFKKSPVGLPVGDYQGNPGFRGDSVQITPELAKLIQETVWEVVATHPLTGVTADEPIKVASPLLDPAVVGEPYRFELLPAFGKAPYVWSLANGKLPEGLTLTESGVLSGAPTAAGIENLTFAVTDSAGAKATASLPLEIEAPVAPVIPEQSLPAMSVGKFMEHTLRSESGNGACAWRVKEGSALPPGLSLDGYGRLWGAPGKEGSYEFIIEVVDGKAKNPGLAERAFTLQVGPANGEIAFARRLTEKIELCHWKEEGDPSPWNFRYPITKLVEGEAATVSGAFDLAWDDEFLWVAIRIKDATNTNGAPGNAFRGDNIVLCIDGFNNREATYNADDRFIIAPRKHVWGSPMSIGDRFTGTYRQKELEGGYFMVFRISFRNFGWPAESLPNRVLGLDIVLIDDAKDGIPTSTVVWQGTKDNGTDPSQFGTVVLGGVNLGDCNTQFFQTNTRSMNEMKTNFPNVASAFALAALPLIGRAADKIANAVGTEYHVAVIGADANPGTKDKPFRSIQRAAEAAHPGDTITVHAGIYRERVNPPRGGTSDSERITYQAAAGELVEIRGSEEVQGWSKLKEHVWKIEIPNDVFGDFNPFSAPVTRLSNHWFSPQYEIFSGAVYLDGDWRMQAKELADVLDNQRPTIADFFAEVGERSTVVWAKFPEGDPNERLTEINVRECVFYPDKPGRDFITVRGFVMRHAATPWIAPTTEQPALIGSHWSKGWIIEDNVISHSIVTGISLGKYGDPRKDNMNFNQTIERARLAGWNRDQVGSHIVRRNRVSDCLSSGISGSLGCSFSVIENNIFHDIRTSISPMNGSEMAGIKFHGAIDTLIRGNVVYRCGGSAALWLDWMAQGTRVSGNVFFENTTYDLYVEVNHGPFLVDNNLFLSEKALWDMSQGGAYVHNLIVGSILLHPDPTFRDTPFLQPHSTEHGGMAKVNGGDDRFFNNLIVDSEGFAVYDQEKYSILWKPKFTDGHLCVKQGNALLKVKPVVHPEWENGRLKSVSVDFPVAPEPPDGTCQAVTSERLGSAKVSGAPYLDVDRSALHITRDILGRERKGIVPGPFTELPTVNASIRLDVPLSTAPSHLIDGNLAPK